MECLDKYPLGKRNKPWEFNRIKWSRILKTKTKKHWNLSKLPKKSTRVSKKTNNPELGTGWHRKKRVKITTTYKQPKYKQIPSIKRPTPNPKTNKQTNKQTLLRAWYVQSSLLRKSFDTTTTTLLTNYMNTYRNADSKIN